MATIDRGFNPMTDRYAFDFRRCTYERGWAQIDTSQDASYFGQWISPQERKILSYCEGDITVTTCIDDAEMVSQIAEMQQWNVAQGHRFLGIDPGLGERMQADLVAAGLAEYLHGGAFSASRLEVA